MAQACLGVEGELATELSREFAKSCKSEVINLNPKANTQAADDYCKCYGKALAHNLHDTDVAALIGGRETPHFDAEAKKAVMLCEERHIKSAVQAASSNATYRDLPDIGPDRLIRTQSGVFVVKPDADISVLMDTEQMYMVMIGDLSCGWVTTPLGKQGVREAIEELRSIGPLLARAMMKSTDVQMEHFEETQARNNPAVVIEIRGKRISLSGQVKDTVGLIGAVLEVTNRAAVIGVCFTEANHYDRLRETIRKMSVAAMSSRMYQN
jgi:hypothetical protein